jgi:hypothetical protein
MCSKSLCLTLNIDNATILSLCKRLEVLGKKYVRCSVLYLSDQPKIIKERENAY